MGIYGTMMILTIIAFSLFQFFLKIIGSTQKENAHKSLEEAIQRDTDEFNRS
ncbi:hypothetical protein [Commensalibacter nepenthis]|uniref:Uncharacterized protein n=1 Tax=Commensalibacter nepenthis TaxID=3043872 RepID=A0ABT6Q6Q4_9PROT|nr:hypothetical protein [Commensalibacter sp. TBRC 10068]MDI2112020.1 hypothetical protein [Commensalibacter sp. TBRC 10068]